MVTDAEVTNPTAQTTSTVPTTSQETREVIKALLLLGEPPNQANFDEDDNANLMPIDGGNKVSADPMPAVPPRLMKIIILQGIQHPNQAQYLGWQLRLILLIILLLPQMNQTTPKKPEKYKWEIKVQKRKHSSQKNMD